MKNPEIPGRIQMELFIPVEIFRKKGNTYLSRYYLFLSRFYRNDWNFWYHLFGLPVPGFKSRESEKIYRYFVNGTTQSRSCFRCQKKYQYHFTEIFHQNFRKRSRTTTITRFSQYWVSLILSSDRAWTSVVLAGKRGSRRHSTRSFSENVVVAGTSYQILEV